MYFIMTDVFTSMIDIHTVRTATEMIWWLLYVAVYACVNCGRVAAGEGTQNKSAL